MLLPQPLEPGGHGGRPDLRHFHGGKTLCAMFICISGFVDCMYVCMYACMYVYI